MIKFIFSSRSSIEKGLLMSIASSVSFVKSIIVSIEMDDLASLRAPGDHAKDCILEWRLLTMYIMLLSGQSRVFTVMLHRGWLI